MPHPEEAQSIAVKRAQVEFHNFASLGEPDRARRVYLEENVRRGTVIRKHRDYIGELTPFLEIGSNAGHSSYMLANEFGADGFALDISADSLRHGISLMDSWQLLRAPVRVAGDALNLPFQDNSLRTVFAFQMLSQFMDIEAVFLEVKRVLAPGGVFIFAEEPLRRRLSLRLYRCPYVETMKPWERKLLDWGLLGYLVRDVIGAHQEESFGIRQNHRMELCHWDGLIRKHFATYESEIFVPQRGWGENIVGKLSGSQWSLAHRLGGTLAAMCRKEDPRHLSPTNPGRPASAAPIAPPHSAPTKLKPSAASPAPTKPPTRAAFITSSARWTRKNFTPVTATMSSTSRSPATKPASAPAGMPSKGSMATNTAGSATTSPLRSAR